LVSFERVFPFEFELKLLGTLFVFFFQLNVGLLTKLEEGARGELTFLVIHASLVILAV